MAIGWLPLAHQCMPAADATDVFFSPDGSSTPCLFRINVCPTFPHNFGRPHAEPYTADRPATCADISPCFPAASSQERGEPGFARLGCRLQHINTTEPSVERPHVEQHTNTEYRYRRSGGIKMWALLRAMRKAQPVRARVDARGGCEAFGFDMMHLSMAATESSSKKYA